MGMTSIEWADHSLNPLRARNKETRKVGHFCVKISGGCKNCYASKQQSPYLTQLEYVAENRDKVELFFEDKAIQEVLRRRKPTRYFWCDMTDMFGDWVPYKWIDRCFTAMVATPQHTHMILTKRPGRMLEYFRSGRHDDGYGPDRADYHLDQNIWLGVSVEDQKTADERIPLLLQTPAALRFVSYEPALGPVDFDHWSSEGGGEWRHCIDWLIIGGESGPGARPFDLEWARKPLMQFHGTGNAVFLKQLGSAPHSPADRISHRGNPLPMPQGFARFLNDRKGGDPSEWPADLQDCRQFPEARP